MRKFAKNFNQVFNFAKIHHCMQIFQIFFSLKICASVVTVHKFAQFSRSAQIWTNFVTVNKFAQILSQFIDLHKLEQIL